MSFEYEKMPVKPCPVIDIDGVIEKGKQYDIEITLPEDKRNVIYGVVLDDCKDPVENAVVKLIEVDYKMGKETRKPVSHTFTDEEGEFVFGPLCPDKEYAIQIWKDEVRHQKICAKCTHKGDCLKGKKMDGCDHKIEKDDRTEELVDEANNITE